MLNNLGPPSIYAPGRWKSAESPDVVLTPGLMLGGHAMSWMAKHLDANGLQCAIPRLGGLLGYMQTRSMQVAGTRLAKYLKALPPGPKPWLVGHSHGGMISRYAIQEGGAAEHVSGLITLGTPHRGTNTALFGLAMGVGVVSWVPWQLHPYSIMIRRINKAPWPQHLPLLAIVSPADRICRAPAGEPPFQDGVRVRVSEVPGLGHTELLWHREVLDLVTHTIVSQGSKLRTP